ncbi:hypothetical protein [Aquibium oceanicum]|uniref:hypothetical protein n=1 Tax=Aquibium oceanicum TaxID=1670800 RepID=UPI000AC43F8F|nr:hypothetical protein [Aquibium oceanicum]
MKPANYAPVYAGLYPELAEIARKHGYAMAVHGSLARDADLICIPWTDEAESPQAIVDEITTTFAIRERHGGPKVLSTGEPSTPSSSRGLDASSICRSRRGEAAPRWLTEPNAHNPA